MRKLISALVIWILLLGGAVTAKAQPDWLGDMDLRFVDANGVTGYYVDVNSIAIINADECNARVAIVRADENRMFVYMVGFNRKQESYQIMHTAVLQYDTKEDLKENPRPMVPVKYMKNSPMYNVVEFIYNYKPD